MSTKITPRPDNQRPNDWVLEMVRERGSLSPLRYPYAHFLESVVDVEFEQCSPTIYLATPVTTKGSLWLWRSLKPRTVHVQFCDGLVLTHDDYCWLIQHTPDDVCTRSSYYTEAESD